MAPQPTQVHDYGDHIEPIAIIGMACRYPGEAKSVKNFWEMIIDGRNGHSEIPASRWDAEAYYHPSHERRGAVRQEFPHSLESI